MRRTFLLLPISILLELRARSLGLLTSAVLLLGCNEDPGADNGKGDHKPAPLTSSASSAPAYPAAPYGVSKGSTIDDYSFQGFVNAKASNATLQTIHLSDFYNPHADDASYDAPDPADDDRLFPPGSPYGQGSKKPKALLIAIASVWCGPCNQEAKSVFPGLYAKYKPCGGEFLFQLAEGAAPGTPATEKNIRAWTTKYKVNYPATFDAAQQLSPLYSANSFPDSAIVDTRTMKIVEAVTGVPSEGFWKTFEAAIDPACIAAK